MKIKLEKEKIYLGDLITVNAEHPIRQTLLEDLTAVDPHFQKILLRREAAAILRMIFERIGSAGRIVPVSGYRSLAEQEDIYQSSLAENGAEFTKKFVALPNCSEHQTGLAIDLAQKSDNIDFICPDFPYDGICGEFRAAAPEHGFIERYRQGKEEITGIAAEPWHFRYVGYPHSKIIAQNGFALEEYCEFVKRFTQYGRKLRFTENGSDIEIYYVRAADEGATEVDIPENGVYRISGNNIDGFIVTVWRTGE